jgi:uncharacterized protein YerC
MVWRVLILFLVVLTFIFPYKILAQEKSPNKKEEPTVTQPVVTQPTVTQPAVVQPHVLPVNTVKDFVITQDSGIQEPLLSPLLPTLVEALSWQDQELVAYLKALEQLSSECLDSKAWKYCFSQDIFESKSSQSNQNRVQVQSFLKQFSRYSSLKRKSRAAFLGTRWQCSKHQSEGYALALSLERDFPEQESQVWAKEIHKKVSQCEKFFYRDESLIRGALMLMLKQNCAASIDLLKKVNHGDLALRDRSLYLRWLCQDPIVRDQNFLLSLNPIPLGMYGHLLMAQNSFVAKEEVWRIQLKGQHEEYSHFLNGLTYFLQTGQSEKIRWLASHLDTRRLAQKESPQFQATIALIFHKVGFDLPVFKILHQVLAYHPQLASADLLPLMFPVRYWEVIQESAGSDIDPILLKSLIRQESAFASNAQSQARAMGLMQVIPSTARRMGLKNSHQLMDPKTNVYTGTRYLRQLVKQFGFVELALAGYNAGPKRVEEWQKRYPTSDPELFVELIPYRETREYVRLIKRNEAIYRRILSEGSSKVDKDLKKKAKE